MPGASAWAGWGQSLLKQPCAPAQLRRGLRRTSWPLRSANPVVNDQSRMTSHGRESLKCAWCEVKSVGSNDRRQAVARRPISAHWLTRMMALLSVELPSNSFMRRFIFARGNLERFQCSKRSICSGVAVRTKASYCSLPNVSGVGGRRHDIRHATQGGMQAMMQSQQVRRGSLTVQRCGCQAHLRI